MLFLLFFWAFVCVVAWKLLKMAISVELRLWRTIAIIAVFVCVCNIVVLQRSYNNQPIQLISKTQSSEQTAVTKTLPPALKPHTTKVGSKNSGQITAVPQAKSDKISKNEQKQTIAAEPPKKEAPNFSKLVVKNPLFQAVHNLDGFFTPDKSLLLGGKGPRRKTGRPLVCIGVPTVYRHQAYYLVDTIKQLVDNLKTEERSRVIIVIFIADMTPQHRNKVKNDLAQEFAGPIDEGLVEVISAPAQYYPDLNNVPRLYADTSDRVKWRSKQCLDYSYLYYYCADLAEYFIQLEDDVVTNKNYFSYINQFILKHARARWSTLEFGDTGMIIGTTYRSENLRSLAKFARAYFWTMPIDWMVHVYNDIFLYGNKHRQNFTSQPPLFKHIGKFSSLKGKVYKDTNPPANKVFVSAGGTYAGNNIMKAYKGAGIYWGTGLNHGAHLQIELKKPAYLHRVVFKSGSPSNPLDSFKESSLYVSTVAGSCDSNLQLLRRYNSTLVEYKWDEFKAISCVRLSMDKLQVDARGNTRWLIISEISLFDK